MRPSAPGVAPNFDALGSPDPSVGARGLVLGVFAASVVADATAGPKSVDVGCKENQLLADVKSKHFCVTRVTFNQHSILNLLKTKFRAKSGKIMMNVN